jgi:L-lactate dehydrogenase
MSFNAVLKTSRPVTFRKHFPRRLTVRSCQQGRTVGIVGVGNVGSSIARSIISKNIVSEIKLLDRNSELCLGEALDLEDSAFSTGTKVSVATHREIAESSIIIITAGANQKEGESRIDLIDRNAIILKDILKKMFPISGNSIIIIVSNPVDVLTYVAQEICAPCLPRSRVCGSGTVLDTNRLKVGLAEVTNVSPKSVDAFTIGEHGQTQICVLSAAMIGGCSLESFPELTRDKLQEIEDSVKDKANEIIKRKGATSFGIGACVADLCESILLDKGDILPVSVYIPSLDACLGWPAVIGRQGVQKLMPIKLTEDEQQRLYHSAKVLQMTRESLVSQHII